MKLTNFIGAGVLSFVCATTATANPIVNVLVNDPALHAVRQTGTVIVFDTPECESGDFYGLYQFRSEPRLDQMTICVTKHKSMAALLDTIRHEAIHVAQLCRDGTVFKEEFIAKHTTPAVHEQITSSYPRAHWAKELEATVVASQTTQEDVAHIVSDMCKPPAETQQT